MTPSELQKIKKYEHYKQKQSTRSKKYIMKNTVQVFFKYFYNIDIFTSSNTLYT